jgi:hypothetical protein
MNRAQEFRQHHIKRSLKAALDAGVHDPAVCVRLPGGAELVVGAAAGLGRPVVPAGATKAAAVVKPMGKARPAARARPMR